METQNLTISFDYSWFLAKNLAYGLFHEITLGGIQVLRHHDFDLFWPTHPPYHQTSSFPIPTLYKASAFPHTHPPIFFLSLINKAKITQKKMLIKSCCIIFFFFLNDNLVFCACKQKFFFLVYFLITSSFSHPHPPTLSSNIIIWPTHPPTSLMT